MEVASFGGIRDLKLALAGRHHSPWWSPGYDSRDAAGDFRRDGHVTTDGLCFPGTDRHRPRTADRHLCRGHGIRRCNGHYGEHSRYPGRRRHGNGRIPTSKKGQGQRSSRGFLQWIFHGGNPGRVHYASAAALYRGYRPENGRLGDISRRPVRYNPGGSTGGQKSSKRMDIGPFRLDRGHGGYGRYLGLSALWLYAGTGEGFCVCSSPHRVIRLVGSLHGPATDSSLPGYRRGGTGPDQFSPDQE